MPATRTWALTCETALAITDGIKPQACRSCHTDHKGREAKIVEFDPKQFDHALSDFALRGAHLKTECNKCHVAGKKYREAAVDCLSCHRKEDVHKGSLGAKCADCHTEVNWKETKIDHDKTRFPLTGKHVDTKCADCHKNDRYKETPRTCVACHRKDDDGKRGHKGQFGEKCESCHGTKAWKPSTFNHDTETRYALRGKHRTTGCADCHTGHLFKDKVSSDCYACHKKDDKHKESLGRDCGSCHSERGWKEQIKFDHDKTSFPLLGEHAKIECKACHKSAVYKEAPKECIGCHRKDDKHERTLGDKCGDCHIERDWKTTQGRFNHDRTKFKLRNAHAEAKLKCNACHKDLRSYRNTPLDCYSCHKKDDKHEGQQGKACEQCHSDASWKVGGFRPRPNALPVDRKAPDRAVQVLPSDAALPRCAARLFRLPQEGRQAQAQVRRALRVVPQHAGLAGVGLRPRQARQLQARRCAPQGGLRNLPSTRGAQGPRRRAGGQHLRRLSSARRRPRRPVRRALRTVPRRVGLEADHESPPGQH